MSGTCQGTITIEIPSTCTGLIGKVTQQEGDVYIVDALFIAQATVGTRILTDCQLRLADVNGDGVVNITDALFIAQYTVGSLTNTAALVRINKPIPASDLLKPVPILNGAPPTVNPNDPSTW